MQCITTNCHNMTTVSAVLRSTPGLWQHKTMHPDEQHPEGDPKPELIPLEVPVPPGLAAVFGYRADSRFVGFRWEPSGDNVIFDDGQHLGTGHGWAFIAYRNHR